MSEKPSTSERLEEIFKQLTMDQLRFITSMLESRTKKEAAEKIGVKQATVYCWDKRALVDEAIMLIQTEPLESARKIRRKNLIKAMMIKAAGLDSKDEKIRQDVATEIIEAELGKAKQPVEIPETITVVEIIKANGSGTLPPG